MTSIEKGIKRLEQNLKDDSHLIKQLPEQTDSSHKFILKRLEELLHESDLAIFMGNYSALTRTGGNLRKHTKSNET